MAPKVAREHGCSDGSSLGASRLALTLVLSSAQAYQALELIFLGQAALEAALVVLEALAPMPSRMLGSISLVSVRRDRKPAALRRARARAQKPCDWLRRWLSKLPRRSRRWRPCSEVLWACSAWRMALVLYSAVRRTARRRTTCSPRLSSTRRWWPHRFYRSSGCDSLDTPNFEFNQDGLITEAEFDSKVLASSRTGSSPKFEAALRRLHH